MGKGRSSLWPKDTWDNAGAGEEKMTALPVFHW